MGSELAEKVAIVKNLQSQRLALEKQVKDLKTQEDLVKSEVVAYMLEQNMPSVHFAGLAQVILAEKSHLEITDKEKFAETVLRSLVAAYQDNRPFADGLLAQFRPSKEAIMAYLNDHPNISFADCGLRLVNQPELSLRRSTK